MFGIGETDPAVVVTLRNFIEQNATGSAETANVKCLNPEDPTSIFLGRGIRA